jgi:phosphatidylglycerol:prolipoprotein diacylglycerol transferase
MHPILVEFFGFSIHSYGVMLAVGFVVGISLAAREAVRTEVDPEKVLNLAFWILISSIIGSRLFHCIVFYPQYLEDPLRVLMLWEGGLVFYGGFLGALLAGFVYCRVQKLNYWELADLLIPSVMLGLVFGRIGCTLAGCCFGKACGPDFALGMTFENPLGLGVKNTPLYPTQVLSAINGFVIFLILWLYRTRKGFHGELVAICLIVYSITRSLIEILREDPRGFLDVGPVLLSESQVVSVFMLLFAAYVLVWVRPKQYLSPQPQSP